MKLIHKQTAIKIMLGLLSSILVFHLAILLEIIPYSVVWAGKINLVNEMYVFEIVSISIILLLITILLIKRKNIINNQSNKLINILIWIYVLLFALNSVGNLFSQTWIELILGTILTSISSFLCYIIVRSVPQTTYQY